MSGIQPSQRKLQSVREFPTPRGARDVRSFLVLASYFRRFVKNFAVIANPLTNLLRKDAKFSWDDKQNGALELIKTALTSKPLLAIYDHGAETEIHTDACTLGLGAALLQKQLDGKRHPVMPEPWDVGQIFTLSTMSQ
ncbi:uncharacterized mitochondrial protein AtMg00860-like [Osmia bicornis bicornis]|uniref:uncharacterized mitochondrial protein AtMg00860-like n=1 Tax=Osmia bicornis bicornis TaxID=1437191 RepID=UPI0010F4F3D6|nr:uncharacterized mitochondrial protein AtMg00860-like [Osmia bicornis bicornis]